jgi:hypothetical protein
MRKYFIEISILLENFSRCGYYLFKEDVTRTKMNQICQFITAGAANRLKDIPVPITNNEIAARFTVNDFAPNFSSKMKITLIKTKYYSASEIIHGDEEEMQFMAVIFVGSVSSYSIRSISIVCLSVLYCTSLGFCMSCFFQYNDSIFNRSDILIGFFLS